MKKHSKKFLSLDDPENNLEDLFDPSESTPDEIFLRRESNLGDRILMRQAYLELPEIFQVVVARVVIDDWSFQRVEAAFPTLKNRANEVFKNGFQALKVGFVIKQKELQKKLLTFPASFDL